MDARLREAAASDALAMGSIDQSQAAGASLSTAQCAAYCAPATPHQPRAIVLESAAVIVGFIVFDIVFEQGTVHSIQIDPAQVRQGYGGTLLLEALRVMREAGVERCLLEVRCSNNTAIALYEKAGFALDGVRKNYYSVGSAREDALLMSKQLEVTGT